MKKNKKRKEGTGRLKSGIDPRVVEIIFGKDINSALKNELNYSIQVDQAHLIMLSEQKIIPKTNAVRILKAIEQLKRSKYKDLKGKRMSRGLYLLYENHLISRLGASVGGSLHTARSRNDMYATIFRLRLREPFACLTDVMLDLRRILIKMGKKYVKLIMPLHTQMQPAVPSVFSHYLFAVDKALCRDIDGIIDAYSDADLCPLGACAIGGTSFPINEKRTAELLGFRGPKDNSIDSVASYDFVLRLMSAMAIASVTISRLISDFHMWTTEEYGYFRFPDSLSGSSSIMPQKANPFILEHIKGKVSSQIGYLVSAGAAMQKVPFSNAIEVKKEGASHIWHSLDELTQAVILTGLVCNGLIPEKDIALKNKRYAFILASAAADMLVKKTGCSFRDAHSRVGEAVKSALTSGSEFKKALIDELGKDLNAKEIEGLNFSSTIKNMRYGGGPGGDNLSYMAEEAGESLKRQADSVKSMKKNWTAASMKLQKKVRSYISK
ncbi:argininosuccinate lyase [Elusimicrobiota bacterium]